MTSPTPDLAAVMARLEKVERQNRGLKTAGIAVLVLTVVGLLMGQAMPRARIVEAEGFLLKDGAGKVWGGLGVDENASRLFLADEKGKTRAELSGSKYGSMLLLRDENGKGRASLVLLKFNSGLELYDENRKFGAMLNVNEDGPRLSLHDENRKGRVGLGVDKDGPRLGLYDEKGKIRAALGRTELEAIKTGTVEQRAESSLVLFDRDGKVLWQTP